VGDPCYGWSDIRNFTALPDGFPFAATVIADSGALENDLNLLSLLLLVTGSHCTCHTVRMFGCGGYSQVQRQLLQQLLDAALFNTPRTKP
jgi:hypothetical protein